jgi:hypothetical protein
MSIKINPLMRGVPPGGKPFAVLNSARIVITVDMTKGASVLKSEGPLTLPFIIDVLISQISNLWRQWMQAQMGIVGASTTPEPAPPPVHTESEPGGESAG